MMGEGKTGCGYRLCGDRERQLCAQWARQHRSGEPGHYAHAWKSRSGWEVLFVVPVADIPAHWSEVFLDLNCLTDRSRRHEGLLRRVELGGQQLLIAGFEVPDRWRGSYRFLAAPGVDAAIEQWAHARRTGSVGVAPDRWVHRQAPFSPVIEYAVPDAPCAYWVRQVGGVDHGEELPDLWHRDSCYSRIYRFTGGRGVLVVLDGQQFDAFGLIAGLGQLPVPPAVVLSVGSTEAPWRRSDYAGNWAMRDRVLGVARQLVPDGPVRVVGSSLGGAAAAWWAMGRPDVVDHAIVLSGSFWLRDNHNRLLWDASLTWVPCRFHIGWGQCEEKIAPGCRTAVAELRQHGHRVTTSSWVGGHDFVHWAEAAVGTLAELG